ncbi:MAG: hypothetical protein IPK19_08810 [Chloroflexi bacterium]|nr:hypothetical protein [Chloroflexota bacterium]
MSVELTAKALLKSNKALDALNVAVSYCKAMGLQPYGPSPLGDCGETPIQAVSVSSPPVDGDARQKECSEFRLCGAVAVVREQDKFRFLEL